MRQSGKPINVKLLPMSNPWKSVRFSAVPMGSLTALLASALIANAQLPGPGDLPPNASSTAVTPPPAGTKPATGKEAMAPIPAIAAPAVPSVLPGPGDLAAERRFKTVPKPNPEAATKKEADRHARGRIRDADGPKFIGAVGCSSSLCHGGGSPVHGRYSYTIWKSKDPHRQSYAVLAGPRSQRMAQALQLGDATQATRCTECHAPLKSVPEERLSAGLNPATEGVSCESCHGPAQNWIRSHTRLDISHAQNAETGLRDLNNLYVRANNCIACHQVLSPRHSGGGASSA